MSSSANFDAVTSPRRQATGACAGANPIWERWRADESRATVQTAGTINTTSRHTTTNSSSILQSQGKRPNGLQAAQGNIDCPPRTSRRPAGTGSAQIESEAGASVPPRATGKREARVPAGRVRPGRSSPVGR
jgi:hypothetical protein